MPSTGTSALVAFIARAALPYWDPVRRRRVRRAARRLVECSPWPGDEATAMDVAQLALLRLLWLQRETRRAARWRQSEAVALLARTSIETCLTGMYCLYAVDPVQQLRGDNAKSLGRILGYLVSDGGLTPEVVDAAVRSLAGSPGGYPTVKDMAAKVAEGTGESFATDMYDRLYVPTSTFFVHARGLALLRHVDRDDTLLDRPGFPWTARSAVRTADACVGILAAFIARRTRDNAAVGPFLEYANSHMKRSMTPLIMAGARGVLRSIKWHRMPGGARVLLDLRRYYASGQAASDPPGVREARTREGYERLLDIVGIEASDPEMQAIVDHFVQVTTISDDGSSAES
jgi:hypothetical protein